MTFLLRIEAINYDSVFADTSQVSVLRGASLLLREAPTRVAEQLCVPDRDQILVGGSIGIFRLPTSRKTEVTDFLQNDPELKHFTFAVAEVPLSANPRADLARLARETTLQQLRQPTLAPPGPSQGSEVCEEDKWRPATKDIPLRGKSRRVSESVAIRATHGKKEKRSFHLHHVGLQEKDFPFDFTQDLEELATDATEDHRQLNRKMAVIALDGNEFGKLRDAAMEAKEDPFEGLKAFWTNYEDNLKQFHRDWLNWAAKDPAFQFPNPEDPAKPKLQMEFLMWGGDELVLVVPAWRGLETLHLFLEHAQGWRSPSRSPEGTPMTFSAGLVFCGRKSPLYLVKELADALMTKAKDQMKVSVKHNGGPLQHAWDYLVLEAEDYAREDLGDFLEHTYSDRAGSRGSHGGPWNGAILAKTLDVLEDFPKRQLYRIGQAAVNNGMADELKLVRELLGEQAVATLEGHAQNLLISPLGRPRLDAWAWLHLLELKDYLRPWTHGTNPVTESQEVEP